MYHDLKDCHLPLSFKPAPSLSGIFTQATAFAGELRGIQQQQDEAEVGRHHQRDRRHQDLHQKVNLVIADPVCHSNQQRSVAFIRCFAFYKDRCQQSFLFFLLGTK